MHSGKFTKIIATIGPSCEDEETIKSLIQHGVNVFRFNTKHNTNEWHEANIKKVKRVALSLGIPVGILVDLQGPEIRVDTYGGQAVNYQKGDVILFVNSFSLVEQKLTSEECTRVLQIKSKQVFDVMKKGDLFSLDDGFIDFEVVHVYKHGFAAEIKEDAFIKNRRGMNLVEKDVDLPALTISDKARIGMAAKLKVDFIALSFVRTAKDILSLRKEMQKYNYEADIISKLESQLGVDNIDEIIKYTDGLMIARGDLGIEVPIERLTYLQKNIIKKMRDANKPVIVATQMLQSMIENPKPTRAEATDIANAIFDETDAIMLSGETASGKYPLKSVETMARIARFNENHKTLYKYSPKFSTQTHVIINAAVNVLQNSIDDKIDKVIVLTESGFTAKVISSFRPHTKVIAVSSNENTVGKLSLSYGIWPIKLKLPRSQDFYTPELLEMLLQNKMIEKGDNVLILHGEKYLKSGSTNALVIIRA